MKHFIYCRKSSEAEDRQILSIESQESELVKLTERQGIKINKIFKESKSAKDPGRPIFNQMLFEINKSKDEGVTLVVWKLDRLARNPIDGGNIQWLLQQNIIKNIKTYDRDYYSTDNVLMMSVELGMANQYVRDLSANVKRGNRTKLEKGEWPNHAPFGYLNDKTTKTIVVDKKNEKYIKKAFELYATGGYSLIDISNILYQEGLRTASGLKVRKGHIHRIIKNPFYCGVMLRDGKYYKGNHKAIISKDLFDRANDVLTGNLRLRKQTRFFHLRGFLKCGNCGCMLTASTKKGYDYYYCTNGKGNCEQHKKYLRSEKLDQFVTGIFKQIQFDEELVELAYQAAKEKLKYKNQYLDSSAESIKNRLNLLSEGQSRLLDSYITGLTPKAIYEAKMKDLANEKTVLENQLDQINKNGYNENTLELIKEVFLDSNKAEKEYLESKNDKKRKIAENLLWNLSLKNQNLTSFQLKMPYQTLVKVGEKRDFETMLPGLDSNQDDMIQSHVSYR